MLQLPSKSRPGYVQSFSLKSAINAPLFHRVTHLEMASRFIENPEDLGAIIRAALTLQHEQLLQDRADLLEFPDEILYE